jgi:hypothetical protein
VARAASAASISSRRRQASASRIIASAGGSWPAAAHSSTAASSERRAASAVPVAQVGLTDAPQMVRRFGGLPGGLVVPSDHLAVFGDPFTGRRLQPGGGFGVQRLPVAEQDGLVGDITTATRV